LRWAFAFGVALGVGLGVALEVVPAEALDVAVTGGMGIGGVFTDVSVLAMSRDPNTRSGRARLVW
jgi:hypothetical protein